MAYSYNLSFIKEEDFTNHVTDTLIKYNEYFGDMDLKRFNKNIVDPIKLLFDKSFFDLDYESVISNEMNRQRDKSDNNEIGYFHQYMFKYIANCEVPDEGWDVIFTSPKNKIYVELKNKHNTMNSGSAQKIYISMLDQYIKTPNDYCYLVEAIAKKSQNIVWGCSVNKKHIENEHIRRVSIDKFYQEVTGIDNAFYQVCKQLPITISKIINNNPDFISKSPKDTVIEELKEQNPDMLSALYLLAFKTYEGFDKL